MKNETAKREIESLDYYLQNHTDDYSEESHTAMMMAIKALEQEPCEDAISRQAIKRLLENRFIELQKRHDDKRYETNYCLNTILELQPVTPQPKTGHWIRVDKDKCKCDQCEVISFIAMYPNGDKNYCPNCGAKMESEEI